MGFNFHMVKPVVPAALENLLADLLRHNLGRHCGRSVQTPFRSREVLLDVRRLLHE